MSGTRRKPGLLGPYVEGYSAWLDRRGHTALTARNMLKEFGQIGRWLPKRAWRSGSCQRNSWLRSWLIVGGRAVDGFLVFVAESRRYLREVGAVDPAAPTTAMDVLLEQYQGLAGRRPGPGSGDGAAVCRRRFLAQCSTAGVEPSALTGGEVNAFLIAECGRVSAGSAKGRVAELRRCCGSCSSVRSSLSVWGLRCRRSVGGGWRACRRR